MTLLTLATVFLGFFYILYRVAREQQQQIENLHSTIETFNQRVNHKLDQLLSDPNQR